MNHPDLAFSLIAQGWRGLREAKKQDSGPLLTFLAIAIGVAVLVIIRKLNSPGPDLDELTKRAVPKDREELGLEDPKITELRQIQKSILRHERKRGKARGRS